ncbi:hypothetical protein A2501_04185 [Candidatus Uhrbacteria bacterium RIFOXYC12_FULL_57_11]|nr:MAG: hypothetical protein A2501_04185 [Candidatus Uhrbacteria bacterium RIFOXYC12_FULL_57_11]
MYRANGPLIVGYAAWLLLTAAAFVLTSFVQHEGARQLLLLAVQIVDVMLWMWVGIMVTLITIDANAGKQPGSARLPNDAWTLIVPFAWATVLQGLVVLGGLLLFLVPGCIFMVWFAFAQQAVVIDKKRGLDALTQSRALCRGRFFAVTWYLFVGPFLVMLVYLLVLAMVFAAVAALTGTHIDVLFGDQPPLWMDITASVGEIFLMPLIYVYWTLTYLELKK